VTVGSDVIGYDQLVFTTGSAPRRLPAAIGGALAGVHVVRTLADVDAMEAAFREGAKALIVGGGYIGLEAAAVARKLGVSVTLVEMSERILQRVACAETSDYVRALHAEHGADIREGVGLERLLGEGHVTGAVLSDGTELDVDFVIAGVGIVPGDALAGDAGMALENGIATDALGRTDVAGVWAAGDCASFPHGGAQMRLESVGHAIDHAELVAENIMGAGKTYTPKPWFWSDQYDLKLQIAGLGSGHDRVVVRHDGDAVSHWYYADEHLLAVDALNDPRSYMIGKRLIEAGKHPAPELIADPDTDMKALLKA
jgi:3-phenylpropionate/trans-cinnamate dioxygenase ferredoxin reductase subunit